MIEGNVRLKNEKYLFQSIAFILITKIENNQECILLQEHYNAGMLNGEYDVSCSGHLEKNETSKKVAIREAKEELGITIEEKDIEFFAALNANYMEIYSTFLWHFM